MKLYQVQLETGDDIFILEVSTDAFDAVDIAREYLKGIGMDKPTSVGGYAEIGTSDKAGVVLYKRFP